MRPERVLAINLDRRADRWQALLARWVQATGGVPITRIPGVDTPASPAAGCWQAHLHALDAAAGSGPVLVLEDDAVFTPDFSIELPEPPAGWALLRLGGHLRAGVAVPGSPWTLVRRITHTHAYVARDPALIAARIAADARRDVGLALQSGFPGHWRLSPATVGQAAGRSDVTPGRVTETDEMWK
jgi:hypothetical protein